MTLKHARKLCTWKHQGQKHQLVGLHDQHAVLEFSDIAVCDDDLNLNSGTSKCSDRQLACPGRTRTQYAQMLDRRLVVRGGTLDKGRTLMSVENTWEKLSVLAL